MITKYKQHITPLIAIIADPFLSWNPSVLTVLSLTSAVLFFIGMVTSLYWLSVVSILGFAFDALDGYVARKTGKVSSFGAFLDSTLDRVADFFFIAAFGYAHLVAWGIVVPVLGTTFLISYIRTRGESTFHIDQPMAEGLMQRSERIICILVAFFLFLLFPHFTFFHISLLTGAFSLIILLNSITILQRFVLFAKLR